MTPRHAARRALILGGYGGLLAYFVWPMLASGARLGIDDWDPLLLLHATVFRSVWEYGQLPFWTPWSCGGDVLWQNPQSSLVSPAYLLATVLSVPAAMKWNIVLHYAIGFAGMRWLLVRGCRLTFEPAILFLSAVYTFGGGEAFHLAVGHATFLPYFYLPWLLWLFIRTVDEGLMRSAVCAAAILALAIYAGGIYLTFMAAVGLCCFALFATLVRRDWHPLVALCVTGALGILLAAPKLVPVLAFIRDPQVVDVRNFMPRPDVMTADMLLNAFLNPFQLFGMMFAGQNYGWHEYANYVGPLAVALLASGFLWILTERPWAREHWVGTSLAATSLVLFLLMLGEFGAYAPYSLLRRLPLMSSFRLPSRYTLPFLLFATTAAGWALAMAADGRPAGRRLDRSGRHLDRLVGLVLIFASVLLVNWNRAPLVHAFPLEAAPVAMHFLDRPGAPTVDVNTDAFGPDSPMMRGFAANRALLRCNEPLQLRGRVDPARPIVFADGDARLSSVAFSPNRVRFGVVARGDTRVFLNERYVAGWRSTAGPLALDPRSGLAYVRLPAGSAGRFAFVFTPPGLLIGLGLAAVGLLASAGAWRRRFGRAPASTGPPHIER